MRLLAPALLATLLAAPLGGAACAQDIPRSQLGSVSQLVAGTRVEVTYRRPVARGRELFGALVPSGRIWTPSADTVARVTFSGPVRVNGQELAAGSYGLWSIPGESSWTLIFSSVPNAFHLRYPEGRDVLRVQSPTERGEHVETLQFAFPMVDADSALLQLRWGTTVVPMRIRAAR
jgi:Protein of unknown function (DUF2911)